MPGSTPNRHYPYPLDADGLDIAGDIQDLAMAIDVDVTSFSGSVLPGGSVALTIAAAEPAGWAFLNGQTIPGADVAYPQLWAVAPATWKVGTGIVLPDARGRFLVAAGGSFNLGTIGGSNSRVLSIAQMPHHSHGGITGIDTNNHVHSTPDHLHHPGGLYVPPHNHGPGQGPGYFTYAPGTGQALAAGGNFEFATPGQTDNNLAQGVLGMTGPADRSLQTGGVSAWHQHGVTGEGGGQPVDIAPAHISLNLMVRLR